MAHENNRRILLSSIACLVGMTLASFQALEASAQDMPPGVTVAANGAFEAPEDLGAFQAMTFVIDVAPGAAFPLHSHPGRSEVMILQGELTENKATGENKTYRAGDSFIEETDAVHSVTNNGSDDVRLVWTLLLPDGAEPIVVHGN